MDGREAIHSRPSTLAQASCVNDGRESGPGGWAPSLDAEARGPSPRTPVRPHHAAPPGLDGGARSTAREGVPD